jgi:acetylornithine/N-succinyldiaminopimelate aminotransferase
MNAIEVEDRLGITFCDRQPLVIERGEGNYVWDDRGKCYLDFTSGWGVTCLGHAHPVIVAAICKQAQKITQNPNSGFTYSPRRAELLLRLRQILPANLGRLYFANSGAEANDAAIKLARKITAKSKIVSTLGSFHGRTLNSLSVSGGPHNVNRYLPRLPGNEFVPFGDSHAIAASLDAQTAAVILEPIQGEGGVRIPAMDYLSTVSQLCKQHGALLIIDEIQTGFCRTGKFFAMQWSGENLAPDIVTMGKGIAGGLPFAAFAVTEEINARIEKGDHGGTYCGNPLSCAVATAVVEYLQEHRIAEQVAVQGKYLLDGMHALTLRYPHLIKQARGLGLLTALELRDESHIPLVTQSCMQNGLLVTPTRNGIARLIPGLLIERAEIDEALDILQTSFADLSMQVAGAS